MKRAFCLLSLGLAVASQPVLAETVSVTDADGNGFGNTVGVAIDFDATTGITADWTADLAAGSTYSVDSVTLFARGAVNSDPVYLGVYSSLTGDTGVAGNATLGGFLGVSDNTQVFSGTGARTWTFSGINVVAGSEAGNLSDLAGGSSTTELENGEVISGDGILFFVYQTETTALTELPAVLSPDTDQFAFRRIDGGDGSVDDELAAVLQGGNIGSTGADVYKTSRVPEYEASVTLVPEPGSIALLVLGGTLGLRRRR